MPLYMLVDGYNVINNWQMLKEIAKRSLEDARDKLIDLLADFKGYTGINIILVFDAMYVKGSLEKHEEINGIEVVYTKEGESADHFIESKVVELVKKEDVVVVSSDWIVQQVVMAHGAIRMSARELYEEMNRYIEKHKKEYMNTFYKDNLENRLDEETVKKLRQMRENQ
ncbi:NYN domain-containing protein [Caldanaerobacter subterraneus]